MKTISKGLASKIWNARTLKDIQSILAEVEASEGALTWRAIGDRQNNSGTIRMASDPLLAIIERITNGMDSVLDLEHLRHPGDDDIANPRAAAEKWLKLPKGGIGVMGRKERRKLAERVRLTFVNSGDKRRPTLVVDDQGTGQTRLAVPKTLCSLNENNKVKQTWTMGTYGQGGSVTLGFCDAAVIITRRHPDFTGGDPDEVAWTIVMPQQATDDIMPSYQYLVADSNEVHAFDPQHFPELAHGTRIIHIGYAWQGASDPFTTGPWQFFHSALFDPVMPFIIGGTRSDYERKIGDRVVIGNAARLAHRDVDETTSRGNIEIPHREAFNVDLGHELGEVTMNYWVVQRPAGSDSKTDDAAASYVTASTAICLTLYGQRQDSESRAWIKDRVKLPFLYKNLVIQVSCDRLTARGKNLLFAATRERATRGDLHTLIYERLVDAMLDDSELRRLEREAKERVLARSTSAASEKVRKRLGEFIKTKLKGVTAPGKGGTVGAGAGGRKARAGHTSPPRDVDDSHLPNFPTKIVFDKTALRVVQGSKTHVGVEINAKNGYLPLHDSDLDITFTGANSTKVRCAMRSRLMGGRARWYFEADGDARLGDYAVNVAMVTPTGVLTADLTLNVVAPPPAKPQKSAPEEETGPRLEWVRADQWEVFTPPWDAFEVGAVTEDTEETIIWVNRDYKLLADALASRTLTAEQIDRRAERFQFPVACALWLQFDAARKASPKPADDYLKSERQRIAEAVLMAATPDVDLAAEEGEA